jgi:hypothetical protein
MWCHRGQGVGAENFGSLVKIWSLFGSRRFPQALALQPLDTARSRPRSAQGAGRQAGGAVATAPTAAARYMDDSFSGDPFGAVPVRRPHYANDSFVQGGHAINLS